MKKLLVILLFLFSCQTAVAQEEELKLEIRGTGPLQGEPVLLLLETAKPALWAKATWLGQSLRFDPADGKLIAMAAIDRNKKPGAYPLAVEVTYEDGSRKSYSRSVRIKGKTFQTQKLRVDPRFVQLSKADLARAKEDSAAAGRAYATTGPERLWHSAFLKPAEARWSGPFGVRRMFNGEERSYHSGADIAVPKGTEIKASNSGRVALVRDMFFGGKTVLIDHGQGVFTGYMHLSTFKVKEGQLVEKGEVIGLSGKTGRVTGPHLHWMLRVNNIKVNPVGLLQMEVN